MSRNAGSQPAVAAPAAARRKSRERIAWALAAVGLAAAVIALVLLVSTPKDIESIRASITPPAGTGLDEFWSNIALSPDGRTVAFVAFGSAGDSIWVRPLASDSARPLPDTRGAGPLFWSYDSRTLAYFDPNEGKLKKIAIDGGSAVTLATAKTGRGGTWNRDGVIVFAPAPEGVLLRMPAPSSMYVTRQAFCS